MTRRDANAGDPFTGEDSLPGASYVAPELEPYVAELDEYGVPVRPRPPSATTVSLALASLACGSLLMWLSLSQLIGRHKPDGMLLWGVIPAIAAAYTAGALQKHPDQRIKRIAKAGTILGVVSVFALVIASGNGDALNSAG